MISDDVAFVLFLATLPYGAYVLWKECTLPAIPFREDAAKKNGSRS